jgi:hypothetical protein
VRGARRRHRHCVDTTAFPPRTAHHHHHKHQQRQQARAAESTAGLFLYPILVDAELAHDVPRPAGVGPKGPVAPEPRHHHERHQLLGADASAPVRVKCPKERPARRAVVVSAAAAATAVDSAGAVVAAAATAACPGTLWQAGNAVVVVVPAAAATMAAPIAAPPSPSFSQLRRRRQRMNGRHCAASEVKAHRPAP